jgi:hypothetical protein
MKCQFPNCKRFCPEGERYCPGHKKMMLKGSASAAKKSAPKQKKPLKKRAGKMTKAIRQLKKIATAFLALPGNQVCQIQSPVCTKEATCVNHKKGRTGKLLLDTKYFQPSCGACNNYIEEKDAFGREGGHKVSRLTK